ASRRKIVVTNTPGVLTETTADFTWALLLAVARRVVEADAYTRAGQYKEWGLQLLLGGDVFGRTLGILGLGRVGKAVRRRGPGVRQGRRRGARGVQQADALRRRGAGPRRRAGARGRLPAEGDDPGRGGLRNRARPPAPRDSSLHRRGRASPDEADRLSGQRRS